MAETNSNTLKRQREELSQIEDIEETKRHKSYNHILSLLEEEEDEPTQDLSALITTLQQELSSDPLSCANIKESGQESLTTALTTTIEDYASSSSSSFSNYNFLKEDAKDDKERVIRHLLEASDDELGIPNREVVHHEEGLVIGEGGLINVNGGVDGLAFCDGLWEFEDVNAYYYTLLQSELFM